MRNFRVGQTQLQRLRSILNRSRRYYIVLALAGAFMFSPLMLLTKVHADGFAGPGVYWIRSKPSGKALDIDLRGFHNRENNLKLIQWDYHGGSNQQFLIAGTCGPYYTIRARHSDKLLDVYGGSRDDGAGLQQFQENGGENQQFCIVAVGDGNYKIVARHSGKVLEAPGATTASKLFSGLRSSGGTVSFSISYRSSSSESTTNASAGPKSQDGLWRPHR